MRRNGGSSNSRDVIVLSDKAYIVLPPWVHASAVHRQLPQLHLSLPRTSQASKPCLCAARQFILINCADEDTAHLSINHGIE